MNSAELVVDVAHNEPAVGALLSAAARDHVKVVAYLISEKRTNPATNTKDAQTLAANVGAINCDWLLTAHRWDELRS